ncbi:hypothetical protein [Vibrio owensii]|uniref:hypothetical protein n=1 Tax=Vibrio owensii TaxID=696485 RepID=UPI0018F1F103|nr:hypothetical protein [Vibrio owensii]
MNINFDVNDRELKGQLKDLSVSKGEVQLMEELRLMAVIACYADAYVEVSSDSGVLLEVLGFREIDLADYVAAVEV